ncbi:MAG TPA: hypothetical protein VMQ60_09600, partial [Acidobacteriaceae bacterium]|nr:hypothetical protein [Acidobacteriaceae bacterium]
GDARVITTHFLNSLAYSEVLFCLAALCAITLKKQWSEYWSLGAFLATRFLSDVILIPLFNLSHQTVNGHSTASAHSAYVAYFYVYWISFAIESILALIVVYSIFRLAMAPLKGLQQLGMLVFRWAASISIIVALGSAFAPDMTRTRYLIAAISQLQRTQSILTLCLLVFVCFAIRPMGLNYGSRIFGISLGLGVMATNDLLQSAGIALHLHIYSAYNLVNGVVICVVLATWTAYFALPEPKRRIIVLPTTSPFLRWNQISQVLGDNPGYVAVGGLPPELLAPAELEVMHRASRKMVVPFPKSMSA